ncbi:MAG: hydrogenase maturation protease [Chthonomonadales bacterium]|nr:hydrogenase maturation protease [Chthonomonadales bacterium]
MREGAVARGPQVVIGYGSSLRRDDGVGQEVARRVEALGLADVRVLAMHQLTPETSVVLASARLVVFVDARADDLDQGVLVESIAPEPARTGVGHFADPRALLALARDLFGAAPEAWLVTVPAFDTGLGEGLSVWAAHGAEEAARRVLALLKAHGGAPKRVLQ